MGGVVEGATVGFFLGKLLNAIIDEATTAVEFRSSFKSIESKITLLTSSIEQMEQELGDENKEFIEVLEKGTQLVKKCSKVRFWDVINRRTYLKSLSKLDLSISNYVDITLPLLTATAALKTSSEVKHLSRMFENYISSGRTDEDEDGLGSSDSCTMHELPTHTFGLETPLEELKKKLFDEKVKVLVMCGPGGCGKTTLAKKLREDSQIKGMYGENIHFLTVSEVPNEMELNRLKLTCNGVHSKPKLVILDDIWLGSAEIIDDFLTSVPDLKLLVTSRFELPKCRHQYQLKLLDVQDAEKLFYHAVSFGSVSGDEPQPDKKLANKVLKICNGLPLALKVIGASLKGQHWTVWETRVAEMVKGQTFADYEEVVLNCLWPSLDELNLNQKESFLDLGAFPEDMRIPAAVLVDISVELYKEDKNGIYALRNLFDLHLRHLVSMLVTREDPSRVRGFCNEIFVTQHDLLRRLAIFETNKAPVENRARLFIDITGKDVSGASPTFVGSFFFPPSGEKTEENKTCSARLVSITADETFASKLIDKQFPKAEVLILNLKSELFGLPDFMKTMNNLKVLIITNSGLFPTKLKNVKILGDLPNLKRVRFERISISSLGHSGVRFQSLTKVSFIMCAIQQATENCSVQLSEMLPALEEIDIDCCEDLSVLPHGLCDLPFLARLSLTNCPKLSALPEEVSNLSNVEALRLHTCTELSDIPNSISHLKNLKVLDISDCISLNQLPKDIGQLTSLETLLMSGCPDLLQLPHSVTSLVNVSLVHCDEGVADLWKDVGKQLKKLDVKVQKKDSNLKWLS